MARSKCWVHILHVNSMRHCTYSTISQIKYLLFRWLELILRNWLSVAFNNQYRVVMVAQLQCIGACACAMQTGIFRYDGILDANRTSKHLFCNWSFEIYCWLTLLHIYIQYIEPFQMHHTHWSNCMKMIDIILMQNIKISDHIWNKFWIGAVTFVGFSMNFPIEKTFYATILL